MKVQMLKTTITITKCIKNS